MKEGSKVFLLNYAKKETVSLSYKKERDSKEEDGFVRRREKSF